MRWWHDRLGRVKPRALLLDLDGTLIDSEPRSRAAFGALFTDHGWDPDPEQIHRFAGRRAIDVFAEAGPWAGHAPQDLFVELLGLYSDDLPLLAIAGARELLMAAGEAGVPVAVVTSAPLLYAQSALAEVLDAADLVRGYVTSESITQGKPHPEGFLRGAELLGVAPRDCWAAEDTPDGVRAARAAGVRFVLGLTTTFPAEVLRAAGAHELAPDLSGLASRLATQQAQPAAASDDAGTDV